MPRSVAVFEMTGLKVIPAPTAFEGGKPFNLLAMLPDAGAMNISRYALHEIVGSYWYKVHYRSL